MLFCNAASDYTELYVVYNFMRGSHLSTFQKVNAQNPDDVRAVWLIQGRTQVHFATINLYCIFSGKFHNVSENLNNLNHNSEFKFQLQSRLVMRSVLSQHFSHSNYRMKNLLQSLNTVKTSWRSPTWTRLLSTVAAASPPFDRNLTLTLMTGLKFW